MAIKDLLQVSDYESNAESDVILFNDENLTFQHNKLIAHFFVNLTRKPESLI